MEFINTVQSVPGLVSCAASTHPEIPRAWRRIAAGSTRSNTRGGAFPRCACAAISTEVFARARFPNEGCPRNIVISNTLAIESCFFRCLFDSTCTSDSRHSTAVTLAAFAIANGVARLSNPTSPPYYQRRRSSCSWHRGSWYRGSCCSCHRRYTKNEQFCCLKVSLMPRIASRPNQHRQTSSQHRTNL